MASGVRVAPLDGVVLIEAEAGGQTVKLRVTREYALKLAAQLRVAAGERDAQRDNISNIIDAAGLGDLFKGRR